MNLDDLTIRQIKEIQNLGICKTKNKIERDMIGKTCMFRTYSAGVHFGELAEKDGQDCLVKNAQRVWSWYKASSLSQLAMEGSKDLESSKIAMPVDEIILCQVVEIIPMSEIAIKNLRDAKQWKS